MSSVNTTDGTTQYSMLALGATVAVAAASALYVYGKRCTHQSAPAAQAVAAAAQAARQPEREAGLTIAHSKGLTAFLGEYLKDQRRRPEQVTEFKLNITALDDGFEKTELAKRITDLFKNLKAIDLTVPLAEWFLKAPISTFMQNLADHGITEIRHHVNQRTALPTT